MDLQLENRVSILPSMRAAVLKVLYKTAEVFVFPSRREGFGLPPLEAMACGTPTIAMNLTSIPEIVQDGALLIDGAGAQTWADAIERVLKDDGLRKRLVGRGLKRASELTWEACARKTRKVYQEVSELES